MRKRREATGSSSIIRFVERVYKISHKCSEFVARFLGTRKESFSIVVYEKRIMKEIVV